MTSSEVSRIDQSPGRIADQFFRGPAGDGPQMDMSYSKLASMNGEILELSSKLARVVQERDLLQEALSNTQLEILKAERAQERRFEVQTQLYEERLTELHSVIAELSRKLERLQCSDVINEHLEEEAEEEEEEPAVGLGMEEEIGREEEEKENFSLSEDSHNLQHIAEGSDSLADSEDAKERETTEPSTSCEIDDRAVEAGQCISDLEVPELRPCSADDVGPPSSSAEGLLEDEEELQLLQEENRVLHKALAVAQRSSATHKATATALLQERDFLRRKLRECHEMQPPRPPSSTQASDAITIRGLRGSPIPGSAGCPYSGGLTPPPTTHRDPYSPHEEEPPIICKLAEKVRLKKVESGDVNVTSTDLSQVSQLNPGIVEQLAAGIHEESEAQELFHSLATAGGSLLPHERLREFELETERLHAKIDHLKSQNDMLSITLAESKAQCEHVTVLIGKYESNGTALQIAVSNLEQTLEAYEVLIALLDSEIALLVASCRAAGLGVTSKSHLLNDISQEDIVYLIRRAQEQRRSTESVARHLLSSLERSALKECDELPSEDGGAPSRSTSGGDAEGTKGEEQRLRETIKRLKEERNHISSSILSLESVFVEPPSYPPNLQEAQQLDLENAVLMQELTAIREDRAELRAQVYLLEREKLGLDLRVGTLEAQVAAHTVATQHLKSELAEREASIPKEKACDDEGKGFPELSAALRREKELKGRLQELMTTLEKVSRNSEARHGQSQEFINDLKKANGALLSAVDRLKRKQTLKAKRMEQQVVAMAEKHAQQVRNLQRRVTLLEGELGQKTGETSL